MEVHLLPAGLRRVDEARDAGRRATEAFYSPLDEIERASLRSALTKLTTKRPKPA